MFPHRSVTPDPLNLPNSPPSSSQVVAAILCGDACIPSHPITDKLQQSPAISVATTSYAADYSPTKDKTAALIQHLNNLTETLRAWVASDNNWENPDDVPALARQVFDLIWVAWTVPGLMDLSITSNGLLFAREWAILFTGPDSAKVSGNKTTPKPTQLSPHCPPPPPKQQSYTAVAKSALSLVKLTKMMPDLEPECIVAMHRAAEPSPDNCRKAYEGILLSANQVVTDDEIIIITASIRKALNSPEAQASLPRSKSYIKILNVPCFISNGSARVAITPTVIRNAMVKSPMVSLFDLTSTPHVMRASPTSNTLIV
ncbi:hypothetical protein NP233_g5247 [Leucocoprinus birnbaumii]|uniref:Uncharacterized protein n=1 Tax=Leucocoprinus birnbaumii TaxID=56174 RepID=A0AAD5YS30_9AGAR|nr:hypothetical protein NP233_g5247 [Leucocoprinus birnbaumii]